MKTSETLTELAKSLCQFQSEIKDAHKDTQAYNYKYADLGTVLELIRPVMGKYGLSLAQFPVSDGDRVGVTSMLMHKSGEWIRDTLYLPITGSAKMSGAQLAGSVITYARRYSAAAILGITQVDDDAAMPAQPDVSRETQKPVKPAKMATDEQKILIGEFKIAKQIPAKTEAWLSGRELSFEQAEKVLVVCREYGTG